MVRDLHFAAMGMCSGCERKQIQDDDDDDDDDGDNNNK